jgi:hypothetical protein
MRGNHNYLPLSNRKHTTLLKDAHGVFLYDEFVQILFYIVSQCLNTVYAHHVICFCVHVQQSTNCFGHIL